MIFWLATDFMESEKITEKRLTNFLDDFFYQKVQKFLFYILKELYTSISTLAQKLVLTLLNNECEIKILNLTPFGRKIRKHTHS